MCQQKKLTFYYEHIEVMYRLEHSINIAYYLLDCTIKEQRLTALAAEDVDTRKRLVSAQTVLHKRLILASIRQLCIFDGQDSVSVANIEEYPARQLKLLYNDHLLYMLSL